MTMTDTVNYGSSTTPSNYVCSIGGETGVKLWRTADFSRTLYCVDHGASRYSEDVSTMTNEGRHVSGASGKWTYQLGLLVPAVPFEENDAFRQTTDIPPNAMDWWKRLPLHR